MIHIKIEDNRPINLNSTIKMEHKCGCKKPCKECNCRKENKTGKGDE